MLPILNFTWLVFVHFLNFRVVAYFDNSTESRIIESLQLLRHEFQAQFYYCVIFGSRVIHSYKSFHAYWLDNDNNENKLEPYFR